MAKSLEQEIKQSKPFEAIEFAAFLSLQRTADVLMNCLTLVLKNYDLSFSQFNILRILRGTPDGLPIGEISSRMIRREPDITRLLDRLENRGLVTRHREAQDRRVITVRIAGEGLLLLEELDGKVEQTEREFFLNISKSELKDFVNLLDRIRDNHK